MELGLEGKVALVTGGSGEIGQAIGRALAAEGAAVAVSWNTGEETARRLVDDLIGQGTKAVAVHLDQRDVGSVQAAVQHVQDALGPALVAVANAVHWPDRDQPEMDGLVASLTVNTVGTAALLDAVLPGMRAAGWGRIIVVSTDVVAQPMPGLLGYPTAKGALEAASRVLAVREAPHGILTNVVRPGFTLTDRAVTSPFLGRAVIDAEAERTRTKRICTPSDVASVVTYLASAANGHVNGQIVSVAGGRELVR